MRLDTLFHRLDPSHLRSEIDRVAGKWSRRLRRVDRKVVTLEPAEAARGAVLLSYILDPFLLNDPARMPLT